MEATNNNVDLKYREIEREVNRHKASHPHRMLPFLWRTAAKVQKKRKRNEGHERKGVIPMTAAVSGHFWMKKGIMNRNNDDSMTGMRRITSIASLKPPSPIKIPHQGEEPCITNAASTNVAVGANAACTAAIDSISFDDPPARSLRKRALPKNAFNYDANKKPPPPKKKKVPRKRPFLPNSLPKKKFVPLRNYYHPGSFQKFSKECFGNDVDSADESDDEWRERERVTILVSSFRLRMLCTITIFALFCIVFPFWLLENATHTQLSPLHLNLYIFDTLLLLCKEHQRF